MPSFSDLVQSRRQWIDTVLAPWCRQACRRDLLLAEHEWQDLAGRPAPEMTLWLWAWNRFPALCDPGLATLNETLPVTVTCRNGQTRTGYPDARRSLAGQLVLLEPGGQLSEPISIDDILSIDHASHPESPVTGITRAGGVPESPNHQKTP